MFAYLLIAGSAYSSEELPLVGKWPYGNAREIAIDAGRNLVFVGSGAGVLIYDISNPSDPQRRSQIATNETIQHLYYHNNLLHVANFQEGLIIIDVSNPSSPRKVGSYKPAGITFTMRVAARGNYAYLGVEDSTITKGGFFIIDIRDPAIPREVGYYDTPDSNCKGIAISGNYAYVLAGGNRAELYVLDISIPSSPLLVQTTVLGNTWDTLPTCITVSGSYLYVGDWDGIKIFDISNPVSPQIVSYLPDPNLYGVWDIFVSGHYVFYVDKFDTMYIIDVSNPASPLQIGSKGNFSQVWGVVTFGNYAYVAESDSAFSVLDISNPSAPTVLKRNVLPSFSYGVAVNGNYVYLAASLSGLYVIDVSDPTNPVEVYAFATPDMATKAITSGAYLYVTDRANGLYIFDVTNPIRPMEIGHCELRGRPSAMGLALSDRYAYVGTGGLGGGMRIIDISNPSSPVETGSYVIDGSWIDNITVSGQYVYFTNRSGTAALYIVDVSNPSSPQLAGIYNDFANSVSVAGAYAYLSTSSDVKILDISNPSSPQLMGTYPVEAGGPIIAGGRYFSVVGLSDIRVVDANIQFAPQEKAYRQTPWAARYMKISGNYLYVADDQTGLWIYDVSKYMPSGLVYASFPGYGLYSWDGTAWTGLTGDKPESMAVSGSPLYADFGAQGLWKWNGSSWSLLTPDNPETMAASGSTLYADFGAIGLWKHDGSKWTGLTGDNPESMVVSGSTLYVDFGAIGLWKWNGTSWSRITADNPSLLITN
jgi:hypothetical protein